jgi:hypothetical protein
VKKAAALWAYNDAIAFFYPDFEAVYVAPGRVTYRPKPPDDPLATTSAA